MHSRARDILHMLLPLAAPVLLAAAPACSPVGPAPHVLQLSGSTMGTVYQVKVVLADRRDSDSAAVQALIDAELEAVNTRMSAYRPESELSRFNAHDSTEPFEISEMTLRVFEMAQEISEHTRGAFDITVGPLVNAWGFGAVEVAETPPDDAQLRALMAHIGYRKVHVDPVNLTIRKENPAVHCDLAGIAKGYGVDRICIALLDAGFNNFMVEIGGEVRTSGLNPGGLPWRIGIVSPDLALGSVQKIVPISGYAVATSGDYRNFYERDGVQYSHTIDPRTGRPVAHNLASASVIHSECAAADAYATALMVMGPEDGLRWAEENDVAALLLLREPDGRFRSLSTTAFDDAVSAATASPA